MAMLGCVGRRLAGQAWEQRQRRERRAAHVGAVLRRHGLSVVDLGHPPYPPAAKAGV